VKIDLDEDEIRRLIDAVDHYEAYCIQSNVTRRSSGICLCDSEKCSGNDRKAKRSNSAQTGRALTEPSGCA
jgi:hypothetical protein